MKPLTKSLILLAVAVVSLLLIILAVKKAGLIKTQTTSKKAISSQILLITSPVNTFTGTIEKISGNTMVVSRTINTIRHL